MAPFTYTVTTLQPRRIVLRASTARFESVDTITVREVGTGSEITYDASLAVRGPLMLITPLIARAFRRLGDAASDQLRRVVSQ